MPIDALFILGVNGEIIAMRNFTPVSKRDVALDFII